MKKLMVIIAACAAALCGTAKADGVNWFDGGIGAGWPTNTAMYGGTWCDGAAARGQLTADGKLLISADEEEPLSFSATYPKALGHDRAAAYVHLETHTTFTPFSAQALPAVPEDARGAVILVTTSEDPDEAESGTLYYAAWDADAQQNVWKPAATATVSTGEVCRIVMKISRSSTAGYVSIDYSLADRANVNNVQLRQADATSNGMYFTGAGLAESLSAFYLPGESKTVDVQPITGLVVTNVTVGGVSIELKDDGKYNVPYGSEVVIYYAPASGYAMTGDGILNIGTVTKNTTVNSDTPGVPKVEQYGKYLIDKVPYMDFATLNAALKDGDTVTMIADDTLTADATITNAVTFEVGGYVLDTADDVTLTIAANVTFTANDADNLPLSLYVLADRKVTLPSGTEPDDYTLDGADYARAASGATAWVCVGGEWSEAGEVTMNFYFPFWTEYPEEPTAAFFAGYSGDLWTVWPDAECQEVVSMLADAGNQASNYYFDGTWVDEDGEPVAFPDRYVAGDFFPHSTAITYRISYEYKCGEEEVSGASNPNPTAYTIETEAFDLQAASASGYVFTGWTDSDGNEVTGVDPVAMAELQDITLCANFEKGSGPVEPLKPGEPTTYDTPEQAAAAAAAFNADKTAGIVVPTGFTGDKATYAAHFEAVADGTSVTVVLTSDAEAALQADVDEAVTTSGTAEALTDPSATAVSVAAEPGFYYSVVGGTAVGDIKTEGARTLAQEDSVELTKPDLGTTDKAFYRIKAAVK